MKYRYRIWCHDCFNQDFKGCFGGGYEIDEEEFDTPQAAYDAGDEVADNGVWEFDVIDEQGNVVHVE